jgi:hypothetical protein
MSRATTPTKSRALHKSKRNKKWPRHPQDWYVEPTWCNAMLFAAEKFEGRVWDPAAGIGRIPTAAQAAGLEAVASDLVDRGCADHVENFLTCWVKRAPNIVCNVPFKIAEPFVKHALELADGKVAILLPAAWVTGQTRSRWLASTPLRRVYFLAPRPSMPPGPVVMAGHEPSNGLSDFAWYVWLKGYDGAPEIRWLRRDDSGVQGPRPRAVRRPRAEEAPRDQSQRQAQATEGPAAVHPQGRLSRVTQHRSQHEDQSHHQLREAMRSILIGLAFCTFCSPLPWVLLAMLFED